MRNDWQTSMALTRVCSVVSAAWWYSHARLAFPAPTIGFSAIASALHQVDIVDRDRPAVAEEDDENGEADGGFRCRDSQDEQREYLAGEVVQLGREGDEVEIDRQEDQLDRHQDDDDILAIEEDSEHAQREQDSANGQVLTEPDAFSHFRPLQPLTRLDADVLDALMALAPRLLGGILPLDVHPVLQSQHDGADHGDQQHTTSRLENEDVARVDHVAERTRVGDTFDDGHQIGAGEVRRGHEAAGDQQQFQQDDQADHRADRHVLQEALPHGAEIDVEHHDDEEEQHRHGPDIDHDEDQRQELGPGQHEQARRIHEGEDQVQHRVHRIARRDHHQRRGNGDDSKHVKEEQRQGHQMPP